MCSLACRREERPQAHRRHRFQKITVEAGLPASIDLRLERGAAISGTILFDDGSPAAGLAVRALVRHKQGQKDTWSPLPRDTFRHVKAEARTDDLGRYRIGGLRAARLHVQVDLELQNMDHRNAARRRWHCR